MNYATNPLPLTKLGITNCGGDDDDGARQLGPRLEGFLRLLQNLSGWQYPIHWDGIAIFSRAADTQRAIPACASCDVDFVTSDNFAAAKAVTFVIQGLPASISIKSLQNAQLIRVPQLDRRRKRHLRMMQKNSGRNNQPAGLVVYR